MTARGLALVLLASLSTTAEAAPEQPVQPIEIGEPAPRIRLLDRHYLPRSLDELGPREATVLAFVTNACPLAQRYLGRLIALEREYRPLGVVLIGVNVGAGESVLDVADHALRHGVDFPLLKDEGAAAAAALGVTRTPQVVVLDGEGRLRYRGRIDAQYRLGGARPDPGREDLRLALEDVLAGRPPAQPETPVDGCLITREAIEPVEGISFVEVEPIVRQHCRECHQPGSEAPFPLVTYQDVRDQLEMIAEVVEQRRMPPRFVGPSTEHFANTRGLSADERRRLLAWIDAGAPPGDLSQVPPPQLEPRGRWEIGEPDLVLSMGHTVRIPAEGYVDYEYAILPHVFAEDTWVEAIEVSPQTPRVVHHCNVATTTGLTRDDVRFLTGRVPGSGPTVFPPGVAVRIPKGAMLALQIHYVTSGKPETDRISVGLRFPRQPVQQELHHLRISNRDFAIPPGARAHEVRASTTLPRDAEALGLFSHMHLRGRDMSFFAATPDGAREALLRIPSYNFDWQLSYEYARGAKRLPKGTRIEVVAHFDNSAFNPYNPDPKATVAFGEQTYHEMLYGFLFYVDPGERLGLRVDPASGVARPSGRAPRWFKK